MASSSTANASPEAAKQRSSLLHANGNFSNTRQLHEQDHLWQSIRSADSGQAFRAILQQLSEVPVTALRKNMLMHVSPESTALDAMERGFELLSEEQDILSLLRLLRRLQLTKAEVPNSVSHSVLNVASSTKELLVNETSSLLRSWRCTGGRSDRYPSTLVVQLQRNML